MIRIIVGIILVIMAFYLAWDASNTMKRDSFEDCLDAYPDQQITSADMKSFDSIAARIMDKCGASTYEDLERYLTGLKFAAVGIGIGGSILIFSKIRTYRRSRVF